MENAERERSTSSSTISPAAGSSSAKSEQTKACSGTISLSAEDAQIPSSEDFSDASLNPTKQEPNSVLPTQYKTIPLEYYVPGGKFHYINKDFPGLQAIHASPWVFLVPGFLNELECKDLIGAGEEFGLSPSALTLKKGKGETNGLREEHRKCAEARLPAEGRVTAIQERIAKLVNVPVDNFEKLKVSSYGPGGHFASHLDSTAIKGKWSFQPEGYPQQPWTNRMVTVVMYLTTCSEGGETEFTNLPAKTDTSLTAQLKSLFVSPSPTTLSVKPQMGTAVIFFPCCSPSAPGNLKSAPDPFTEHRAKPVVGSKWIAQQWIWGGPYKNLTLAELGTKPDISSVAAYLFKKGDDEDRATFLSMNTSWIKEPANENMVREWIKDRQPNWQQEPPSWLVKIPTELQLPKVQVLELGDLGLPQLTVVRDN